MAPGTVWSVACRPQRRLALQQRRGHPRAERGVGRRVGAAEERGDLLRRDGPGEVEALPELAAEALQGHELVVVFDPFGDGRERQAFAEADDRAHELRLAGGALAEAHDERAVDLQHVDRELVEVAERGVARPEVVEREQHARLLQLLERRQVLDAVLEQDALRHLERQRRRLDAGLLQRTPDVRDEPGLAELAGGGVYALPWAALPPPPRGLLAGALEQPLPQRADQPGLLGERDEVVRRDEAALRVLPADERLDAGDLPRRQLEQRLVVEDELLLVEAVAQVR